VAGLAELAALLRELDDQLITCMRCGFCQGVCPLYRATGREMDVARGKLAILEGLSQKMLEDPAGVKERLERCLLCGSCAAGCPTGVKVLDIFLKAREILTGYLGLSPAKRLVFRQLLARPALFDRLMALAPRLQGLLGRPADELLDTSCGRLGAFLGGRHFKRLAARPLRQLTPSRRTPARHGLPRAALFPGCLVDKLFPRAGQAAIKVLEHHGLGVSLEPGLACCGMPALAAGEAGGFRRLLERNLELLDPKDWDYLVTPCATCAAAIKTMWPVMSQDLIPQERERVMAIARATRDISQLMGELGLMPQPAQGGNGQRRVTYHDPCHLKKSLGVHMEPRRLIAASPGARLVEMAESDWCCGMGGSFNLAHYQLSSQIGHMKLEQVLAAGAQTVATGCPACMLQLTDALSRGRAPVAVRHYLEVYAEALPGGWPGEDA